MTPAQEKEVEIDCRADPTAVPIDPAILYFGTPVVLISTLNEDGTANLAPMSSAWWLGWGCMLGMTSGSKTVENLRRTRQCVLNLPSAEQVAAVDRLALTTGSDPVPGYKVAMGFQFVPDKLGRARMSAAPSEIVSPPRIAECPVQMEAELNDEHPFGIGNPRIRTQISALEVKIVRVHVHAEIRMTSDPDRIDPDKWKPLIMSFRQFYSLGDRLQHSRLSDFPEHMFKPPALRRPHEESGA